MTSNSCGKKGGADVLKGRNFHYLIFFGRNKCRNRCMYIKLYEIDEKIVIHIYR